MINKDELELKNKLSNEKVLLSVYDYDKEMFNSEELRLLFEATKYYIGSRKILSSTWRELLIKLDCLKEVV